jgi:predicted RNA-binding Zn-ribbon protein involved in translation (DUF1610 family)
MVTSLTLMMTASFDPKPRRTTVGDYFNPTGVGPDCHQTASGWCSKHEPTKVTPVRCYSCGHQYAAVTDSIDTACPSCGSQDWTRIRPARPEEES